MARREPLGHGIERWYYGGESPPEPTHPGDPPPPAPQRVPPRDRVREPDDGRIPPVRDPGPHQPGSEGPGWRERSRPW